MKQVMEAWRQASQIAAGVATEILLALVFCALGLAVCAFIGAFV